MSYKYLDLTGLSHFWDKIKAKFDSFSRNDLAILDSKEYSGIYGSANDQASASFYFGTIRPTNWYDMWKIRFRVYASIPNQNNYKQYSDVTFYGNQTEVTYKIENKMYSTGNRCYYYVNLCKLNSTGYNAGYSYIPGINLRSSNNPTSSSYPRTFKIEILETENCTFTFYDAMKKVANIAEYNTTNYVGISEYDGANNGLRETGDDTNIWQLRHNSGNYISSTALYRYILCLQKNETTLIPMNAVNNSTATTKALTTEEFNPFGQMLYYNSTTTVNANASIGAGALFNQYQFDLRYSFNTGTTLTTNKDVFIVAVPQSNGKAKLHTTPITQTLPTSENGLIYIYLGHAYSNYQVEMHAEHPIYQYKNGSLRLYSQYEDYARGLTPVSIVGSDVADTAGWYKIASSTMSGYGNQNLLYLIKDGYMNGSIGILDLEMRADNTSIQCWQVKWLSRHVSIGENTVRIVIDGMTWTMYFKRTQSRYGRVYFTEISNRAINGQMPTYKITYYNSDTPEETEPETTIYSQDGSIVLRAQQDAGGNIISSTYATKSQLPTKVSQLTNDSGYTSNTGTVTSVAVKMNNTTKGTVTTSGTIDLGTVITAHQDISGKQDKLTAGSNIQITNNTISATDTTYSSKTAASGGTAVSLVTTGEKYTWNNKQNALSSQTAYSAKGSATKVPQITTNSLGQVTGITEVTITQPTVNNGTLTIQKNGTSVGTFTANQSGNSTANITVPTKTTDLTNDSGFIESEDETVANIVSLTKEEYDALDTKTPNTLYNIIDDYEDDSITTGSGTINSTYINAAENNHYEKTGHVVAYSFTMTAKGSWGSTTPFVSGLPKPVRNTRFVGIDHSANKIMRFEIKTDGVIYNAYSTQTPSSGYTIEGHVTYITNE